MIKSLQQDFLKNKWESYREYELRCRKLMKDLEDEIIVALKGLKEDNCSYESEVKNTHNFKAIQQSSFMALMRNYEEKNSQLANHIKIL